MKWGRRRRRARPATLQAQPQLLRSGLLYSLLGSYLNSLDSRALDACVARWSALRLWPKALAAVALIVVPTWLRFATVGSMWEGAAFYIAATVPVLGFWLSLDAALDVFKRRYVVALMQTPVWTVPSAPRCFTAVDPH